MLQLSRKTLFRIALLGGAVLVFGGMPAMEAGAKSSNPFPSLAGYWRGGGKIKPAGGPAERISCRATYRVKGTRMRQVIRCVGTDYRFRATSNVTYKPGGRIVGTWNETVYNNGGPATGRVNGKRINMTLTGDQQGRMSITIASKRKHTVHIRMSGAGTASITFRK